MMLVLSYAVWLFAPAFQAWLIVVLWRRGLRRRYPIFFNYTAFSIVTFVALFGIRHCGLQHWYPPYFYAFWTTSIISIGLGFAVIHEVFHGVFRPYDTLRDFGNVLFRWAAVVLVLVAIVTAAGGTNAADVRIMQTILTLERSVRVMQCGLVLFLFLFSSFLGLSSRAHLFGIALGFGIFAAFDLGTAVMRAAFGPMGNAEVSMVRGAVYGLSCILWLFYMRSEEPERRTVEHRLRTTEWNYALSGAVNPPGETFLPMIEDAVERILAQRDSEAVRK